MELLRAYSFELKTKSTHRLLLAKVTGSARFVYNEALKLQESRFKAKQKHLSYAQLCKELTQWKRCQEGLFLKEAPSQVLQQSLKDLDRAYSNFFAKRAALPKKKKKARGNDSFRFPQGVQLDEHNRRIFLPKIGWIAYRKSREVEGTIKNVTVSRGRVGKWMVSIQTQRQLSAAPVHSSKSCIGFDLGVARFATPSDGSAGFKAMLFYKGFERKLLKLQRQLSRRKQGGKNYFKTKRKLRSLHQKIANSRKDALHKATTAISKNHAIVFLEALNVKAMTRSKGSKAKRTKAALKRAILEQGWAEFARQLSYKLEQRGGRLLRVPAAYSSQRCSNCNHVAKQNRKSQALFACVACGHEENADLNAAKNILAAGYAVLACGDEVQLGLSMKQEPTNKALVLSA